MAIALAAIGMCACSLGTAWFLPPPEKVDLGEKEAFFRIASGRAIYDPNSVPIDCTSKDKKVTSVDVARLQCEMDWTCKGYNVWKEVIKSKFGEEYDEEKWWVLKSKTPPDAWQSVPGYMVKKEDSKIYLKKE
jgi:hypothetical protein